MTFATGGVPHPGSWPKECSNYCTIALISHASKVMLKILQATVRAGPHLRSGAEGEANAPEEGASVRNSARGKGHEEGGSAYAKVGSPRGGECVERTLPHTSGVLEIDKLLDFPLILKFSLFK